MAARKIDPKLVERVARAMFGVAFPKAFPYATYSKEVQDKYRRMARAALRVTRGR